MHTDRKLTILRAPGIAYQDFLRWQEELTRQVYQDENKSFLILCNHPLVITEGRGDRQNAHAGLTTTLPAGIPHITIKRGGGVTFHGPNQLIYYPIMRLVRHFGLNQYLDWLQALVVRHVHEQTGLTLEFRRNPLGLWHQDRKLASIGIGINRFVTNHGLALNINRIPLTSAQLMALNPCGLSHDTYCSLEDLIGRPLPISDFFTHFSPGH